MRTPTPAPRPTMWAAIGLSVALAAALLALGWDGADAWAVAAALLLVACVAVCMWAGAQGRIAEREVRRAIEELAGARRESSDAEGGPPWIRRARSRDC